MKRCPECRRDYYDDTLLYCLDDGNALLEGPASGSRSEPGAIATGFLSDEPQTAILHSTAAPDEAPTRAQVDMTGETAALRSGAEAEPRESAGEASERQSLSAHRAAKPLLVAAFFVAVLIGGVFGYRYFSGGAGDQIDSIAVLPFINQSGDIDTEYLSDGLTESIINNLSQLASLRVSPRTSVFRFKNKDVDPIEAAAELGARAIVTGRLLLRGDDLNVSVELLDARSRRQIWGEQYNRKLSDALSVQQTISREISERLRTRLSGEEQQQLTKRDASNSAAFAAYVKGRYYWNRRTSENIRRAIEEFQKAVDLDPNYALAYAGLADCFVVLGDYSGAPEAESVPKVIAFAARALQIDPTLPEAHTALAYSYLQVWEWEKSEREFKRAFELNPKYATARHWYYLWLSTMGRYDDALAEIRRAQELDPLSPIIGFNVATAYLYTGNIESSIAEARKIIELEPNFARAYSVLGLAYLKLNRDSEGINALRKAVELSPKDRQAIRDLGYGLAVTGNRVEATGILRDLEEKHPKREAFGVDVAAIYAGLGDKDRAFEWIKRDIDAKNGRTGRIRYQIPFESLRDDPRFADFLRKMGLTP